MQLHQEDRRSCRGDAAVETGSPFVPPSRAGGLAPTSSDRLLRVHGRVQGVGFRPFVRRLAAELGLRGWVRNDPEGVLLRVEGADHRLDQLADRLARRAPPAARVSRLEWLNPAGAAPLPAAGFAIAPSAVTAAAIATGLPVDLAPCPDCRREWADPADRRHAYPFINCTQCGPRYTILEGLPYDRPRTTMRGFQLCPACRREYDDPRDRRFHAEPNACPDCGPQLLLTDPRGRVLADRAAALAQAATALRAGSIVAVKGVGGFHLMVDATAEPAVATLRRRKHREAKPLAVMFRDLTMLRQWAEPDAAAEARLLSAEAPIVLVPRRARPALAASVAPGNPWVGALLPPSPLHLGLLAAVDRPLVATSANLAEEPLCSDDAEARERLTGIADLFLGHDRPIARSVDDSVVRFAAAGQTILLRRARGYAPSELHLPSRLPAPLLCVGAQMKNTIAIAAGDRVVLSPHLGDLASAATGRLFAQTITTLSALLATDVAGMVHDKHPDYVSTRHAERSGRPRLAVQHHLAHLLAVLLEHEHPADGVLGVAWDGTGHGEDGTVWGGEFLALTGGRAARLARLRPFRLAGGEAAVRDARRVAVTLARAHGENAARRVANRLGISSSDTTRWLTMLDAGLNSPWCSSVGRLFDGVGALLGLGSANSFEGQVPLAVEIAAGPLAPVTGDALPFPVQPAPAGALWEIDWRPAIATLLAAPPPDPSRVAAAFHRGLARAIVEVAQIAGLPTVALGGGCFQNALLRHFADSALRDAGFGVLAPRDLPPNDGAIAAGQALAALWGLTSVELPPSSCASPSPAK